MGGDVTNVLGCGTKPLELPAQEGRPRKTPLVSSVAGWNLLLFIWLPLSNDYWAPPVFGAVCLCILSFYSQKPHPCVFIAIWLDFRFRSQSAMEMNWVTLGQLHSINIIPVRAVVVKIKWGSREQNGNPVWVPIVDKNNNVYLCDYSLAKHKKTPFNFQPEIQGQNS